MPTIDCTEAEAGLTVFELLCRRVAAAPHAYLRKLLREGKIGRAGRPVGEAEVAHAGDLFALPNSRRLHQLLTEALMQPVILFENREMIVVAKPAGLAVHTGLGHERENLTARLERLVRERKERYRVAPVHRLDVGTSGPVLFGKGRQACAALGKLFMAGEVEKFYLGLAAGALPSAGELTSPVPAKGKWKAASTAFRSLERYRDHTLLELRLHSGRTHQIRRQLADAGHPLAGDGRYGGARLPGLPRLFLHGARLALTSPFDGSRLEIACPLPTDLAAVLDARPS